MPRVVDGVEGAVAGMASGGAHSLVTTIDGRVLAFGNNVYLQLKDSDGEELDEPFFAVDGRLGLGAGVEQALTPMAIDGIVIGREGEKGKKGGEEKECVLV